MENDQECSEATGSNIGFLVPDSQLDAADSLPSWDLVTGLPALKDQQVACYEEETEMSEKKAKSDFNPFASTTESEIESEGHAAPLVADTASDNSDSPSKDESDKNVTVVERILSRSAEETERNVDKPIVSTPAQHISSLHLSSEPMLVPETVESFDEVAPSPDAFGSVPRIIPDSPCLDDEDNRSEDDDGVVTFKPVHPTMDPDYQLNTQTCADPSQGKAESQSFHLKFTPSQTDDTEGNDAEKVADVPAEAISAVAGYSTQGRSPLKLRGEQSSPAPSTSMAKPSFHLQKPAATAEEMESEESERSMSVFKRVKAGHTTPQKQRRIREDSDESELLPTSSRKVTVFDVGSELRSPGKHRGKLTVRSKTSVPSKSARRDAPVKSDSKSSSRQRAAVHEDRPEDPNNNGQDSQGEQEVGDGKTTQLKLTRQEVGPSGGDEVLTEAAKSLREQTGEYDASTAQASLVISEDPDSHHIDEDQTMSYVYDGENKSLNLSHEQPSPVTVVKGLADTAANKEVVSSSDDFINPSQKRNPFKGKKQATESSFDEEFRGFDEPTIPDVGTRKDDSAPVISQHSSVGTVSSPQKNLQADSLGKEAISAVSVTSISRMKKEKRPQSSQDLEEYSTIGKDLPSQHSETKGQDDSFAQTSRNSTSTAVPVGSIASHTVDAKVSSPSLHKNDSDDVAKMPAASTSASYIFREGSTLAQSRSLDPYVFHGSQSQNFGDVSALPLSDKPYTFTTVRGRKRTIRTMRKVLRKKVSPKMEEGKSSSTDDTTRAKCSHLPPKPKGVGGRRKQQQKRETQEPEVEKPQSSETGRPESQQTSFTTIQKRTEFSKPYDPPPVKAGPSSHQEASDPRGSETQQLGNQGRSESGDATKKPRKPATVSFSHTVHQEPPALVRELSDNSEHEVERVTVTRITVTVTKTDVYSSKGKLIRSFESSEVTEHISEPPFERIVSPQVSPSRSTSTMTTGDLADVSSSSLSRTYSSGSKTSNPSLDAVPLSQGLPTPAQRQTSFEVKEKLHQTDQGAQGPSTNGVNVLPEADQKRLSTGSNTGHDLFSTPNQSIIDRADSQLGKVVSSSNSTPSIQQVVSPPAGINRPDRDGLSTVSSALNARGRGRSSLTPDAAISQHLAPSSAGEQPMQTDELSSNAGIHGQTSPPVKGADDPPHIETPQRQGSGQSLLGKRLLKSGSKSSGDEDETSKKRKRIDQDREKAKHDTRWQRTEGKQHVGRTKDDQGESTDVQSTGFSIHGVPPSIASGDSNKGPSLAVPSSKSSAGISPEISLQGRAAPGISHSVLLTNYKSKAETGAKVMGKWKDGFYYPGILSKVDHSSKKYMVKFDDGSQRVVKAKEIILAGELPVGQSVMVLTDRDDYVPAMILNHSAGGGDADGAEHLTYHVERDDGVTQMCDRGSLILSEDQAACLLSDEELRVTPDAVSHITSKPADISLENLVEGKRQARATRGSSRDGQPSTSTAASTTAPNSTTKSEASNSGMKRKRGPVSTSTPTPKQSYKKGKEQGTPVKRTVFSPLGGAIASPSESRRSPRKARMGLFESATAKKSSKLFDGMVFILTHIEKTAEARAQEKRLLQDSSLDTSADDNTDVEPDAPPFVKEHIQNMIERGGGTIINSLEETTQPVGQCYLVAAEHQRTIKYLQALAAGMTIVSHQWILQSVAQNKLQALKAYILPAGISLEKKKLIEGPKGCKELSRNTVMVVSGNQEFTDVWTSVLGIAKCHVITRFPTRASKTDPGVDFVVSDATCPPNVIRRCQQLEVPLVSSEWVAQCLINGQLMDVRGHEKYRHDFID